MTTKRCVMCKVLLSTSEFNKKATSKDGLQPHCRECNRQASRAYYGRNRAKHKEDVKPYKRRYARRNLELALRHLLTHPCVDCGEDDPVVLEFDHIRGTKRDGIARLKAQPASAATLLAEIAKCEVRCVNCHRRRTASVLRSRGSG